jgi:hypothetical protein
MDSYVIRRQFTVWEEVEVFADTEDEAMDIAESKWAELSPLIISPLEPTGNCEIVLPE